MKKQFLLLGLLIVAGFINNVIADDCSDQVLVYLTTAGTGLEPMAEQSVAGDATWFYDSNYGARIGARSNEDWLLTPEMDCTDLESIRISFEHTYKYGSSPETEMTMWATDNFTGDVMTTNWTQIEISQYSGNWQFCTIMTDFPESLLGKKSVLAFRYLSTNESYPTWEIKNLTLRTFCKNATSYSVTFLDWDGTVLKQVNVREGGYTYPPQVPERKGYKFIGWDSEEYSYVTRDLTITAQYQKTGIVESPIDLPVIGDASLVVCAQNLQNYYFNYEDTDRPRYSDAAGFADKTHSIVNAMLMIDADIYAFCEVEAQDIVLKQLADSMNVLAGSGVFTYIYDGISEPNSTGNNVKSGFIYRQSKVRPVGSNVTASTQAYYCNTMRIQAFEDIASGERLTLSMNHFKAKDSSSDAGNYKRVKNANDLVYALRNKAADPDILIMGDLNCEYEEEPLQVIVNAGYAEQLLRFDENAYSYCYYGSSQLIDHVFANPSMSSQITGAGVFHITTSCGADSYYNYNYRYSDHDPYVIGINLGETTGIDDEQEGTMQKVNKIFYKGSIYIVLPNGDIYDYMGRKLSDNHEF